MSLDRLEDRLPHSCFSIRWRKTWIVISSGIRSLISSIPECSAWWAPRSGPLPLPGH
jgi:hypothetical protein